MFSFRLDRVLAAVPCVVLLIASTACSDASAPVAPFVNEMAAPAAASTVAGPTAVIGFETRVAGYSNSGNAGWIRVDKSCGGGGRVVNGGRTSACTDRVVRGEPIRVSISSRHANRTRLIGLSGIQADNGFAAGSIIPVPYTRTFVVSDDPTFDNAIVSAVLVDLNSFTFGAVQELRVPIGRRP